MKIFLICPVRNITEEEKAKIEKYVHNLETEGHKVHWPLRDTNQDDPSGSRICNQNLTAIREAEEVHVWWNDKSQGSIFDFGMAFALFKRVKIANRDAIKRTEHKSFQNVLLEYEAEREHYENRIDYGPGSDEIPPGWEDYYWGSKP